MHTSMETCSSVMLTWLKQHAVIEFLTAKKLTPTKIQCHLKRVYGHNVVNRSIINRWAIKFYECNLVKAIIDDEKQQSSNHYQR